MVLKVAVIARFFNITPTLIMYMYILIKVFRFRFVPVSSEITATLIRVHACTINL